MGSRKSWQGWFYSAQVTNLSQQSKRKKAPVKAPQMKTGFHACASSHERTWRVQRTGWSFLSRPCLLDAEVHYHGYGEEADAWVSLEMLKSKVRRVWSPCILCPKGFKGGAARKES